MTLTRKDRWIKRVTLKSEGIAVDDAMNTIHNKDETAKHLTLKMMVGLTLARKDRVYSIEAPVEGGVVDVLDWGESTGKAVAYEVETASNPKAHRDKREQYVGGEVRDVIVIPVTEAPDTPEEMLEWLGGYIA